MNKEQKSKPEKNKKIDELIFSGINIRKKTRKLLDEKSKSKKVVKIG